MVEAYHYSTNYTYPYCDYHLKLVYEGGYDLIEYHLTLPEPYEDKPRYVFWCGIETGQQMYGQNGTGDDQIYVIMPNAKRATPIQRLTISMDII